MVNGYKFTALSGGGAGAMDAQDGAGLGEGDMAIVMQAGDLYFYELDADSGAAESVPEIIAPDNNAGGKRWILITLYTPNEYMRADIAAQGGVGADMSSESVDWNSVDAARSGCSSYLLRGSNPNGPGGSGYYYSFTFEFAHKDGTGNITQLAVGYNMNNLYIRYRYYNTWTKWIELLSAASDQNKHLLAGRRFEFVSSTVAKIKAGLIVYMANSGGTRKLTSDVNVLVYAPLGQGAAFLYVKDNGTVDDLTTADFVLNRTEPGYTDRGWYSGHDRCIGFFMMDSDGNYVRFKHSHRSITIDCTESSGDRPSAVIAGATGLVTGSLSLGWNVAANMRVDCYVSPMSPENKYGSMYYCSNATARTLQILNFNHEGEAEQHVQMEVVTNSDGQAYFGVDNVPPGDPNIEVSLVNGYLNMVGYDFPEGM